MQWQVTELDGPQLEENPSQAPTHPLDGPSILVGDAPWAWCFGAVVVSHKAHLNAHISCAQRLKMMILQRLITL